MNVSQSAELEAAVRQFLEAKNSETTYAAIGRMRAVIESVDADAVKLGLAQTTATASKGVQ